MRWPFGAMVFMLLAAAFAGERTYHYSSHSDNARPYLQAISAPGAGVRVELPEGQTIRAGIVTHHFLASGMMARFFDALRARCSPRSIVLIGPDHFHRGLGRVSVSSLPWKTPFGVLNTDDRILHQIEAAIRLPEDPEAFTGEHSVGVLVPFVKYYFPHARVVTVLVDVRAHGPRLKELRRVVASLMRDPGVLVLLSMDFSHDSIAQIADERDKQAQRVISEMNTGKVDELQVDARRGLWVLLGALNDLGGAQLQVLEHSNSARLTGNPGQRDVTSYFTMVFTAPSPLRGGGATSAQR